MSNSSVACKICGKPLPQRKGRRRVYCGDACRNIAYVQRRDADTAPTANPSAFAVGDQSADSDDVEVIEPMRPRSRAELDRWIVEGTKFDEIIDSPAVLARFMDELLVRIGVYSLFEDHRYQRALNQMIVTYFMVGRMTDGDYRLPVIIR